MWVILERNPVVSLVYKSKTYRSAILLSFPNMTQYKTKLAGLNCNVVILHKKRTEANRHLKNLKSYLMATNTLNSIQQADRLDTNQKRNAQYAVHEDDFKELREFCNTNLQMKLQVFITSTGKVRLHLS